MVIRTKRCPKCLRLNVPREEVNCRACGYTFDWHPAPPSLEPKELPSPARWVAPAPHDISCAALASLFVVGTGQAYNHQKGKGWLLFGVDAILFVSAGLFWSGDLLALAILVWLIAIADAAIVAGRLIHQQQVAPWQWF